MNGRSPEDRSEDKSMTRLIMTGILIGFVIALALFGLKSLIFPMKPLQSITQPTPSETARPIPTVARVETALPATATSGPILFQYDQMWAATGDPAPRFMLSNLDGKIVTLEEFKGKPVIVNFWATWCQYCSDEMKAFQNIYTEYKETGLVILAINEIEDDDLPMVRSFVNENALTFPILLDTETSQTGVKYGVNGLPVSYFIDQNGILRRIQVGAMTKDMIEQYLQVIMPGE